jgi:purine-binding chemotaxis protein CheW
MTVEEQLDDTEAEDDASSTYLTFDLGEQSLGVEVRHVREILDRQCITRLPDAPTEVLGVVDVRGACVPIVDLKGRLGIPPKELGEDARIVVFQIREGSGTRPLGVLADRVRNVDAIPDAEIEPAPSVGFGRWDSRHLRGISRRGRDLVVLIELERVLGGDAAEPAASPGVARV